MNDATRPESPRTDVAVRASELRDSGASLSATARALEDEGYLTGRSGPWTRMKVHDLLKSPLTAGRVAPCTSCGLPTRSKYGVCGRFSCRNEYSRLAEIANPRKPHAKEVRNERLKGYRRAQKGPPAVYGVWFPASGVLKVGFTTSTQHSIFVHWARRRAKRHDMDTAGTRCIWYRPGDMKVEAWMQATLAFKWQPVYERRTNTICEWFYVPGLTSAEITDGLDGTYELLPVDSVGTPLAA